LYETGYPQLYFKGKMHRAHRVVLYLTSNFGLKSPLDVMHSCDVRACVNKKHLSTGTRSSNMQDAKKKGRTRNQNSAKSNCGRVLPKTTVIALRKMCEEIKRQLGG
jgi:hypothetical protein